ncbi:MAG: hypothetical protein EFT35_09140 [Methanophagales archaeon ANME-1-THS]|nr:MAG: hypothetical protein EFT35_09140 [Methanophagales archaeon ANME-1-THS]
MQNKIAAILRITADKRLRYTSPKLPLATSFIRKPLYAIAFNMIKMSIQEIAKMVRDAVEGKSRIAFFVGTGISMKKDDHDEDLCPGFSSLNEQVIRSIAGGEKGFENYLNQIVGNERARPEIVLQMARDEISPQVISCLDILIGDNLNSYHRLLARALQAGNCVFTTNFESRIEKACEEMGFIPKVCSSDEDFYSCLFHSRQKASYSVVIYLSFMARLMK